jgi:uncharacterized HAD superfamily protein
LPRIRSFQNERTADASIGHAEDAVTVEEFYKWENQTEEKIYKVRNPGTERARKLLD